MSWDRLLWGIEFSSKNDGLGDKPMLIGGNWHPDNKPRYPGEPSRPVLFETRKLAREWCAAKNEWCKSRNDLCKYWHFRPVRVRESVCLTQRAPDGLPRAAKEDDPEK